MNEFDPTGADSFVLAEALMGMLLSRVVSGFCTVMVSATSGRVMFSGQHPWLVPEPGSVQPQTAWGGGLCAKATGVVVTSWNFCGAASPAGTSPSMAESCTRYEPGTTFR